MKLNNKGYAITIIVFGMLIVFIIILGSLLVTMNNSIKLNDYIKEDVIEEIENKTTCSRTSNLVCKRATTLHTEECTQTDATNYCSGAGYTSSGSKGTTTITYGNLGARGTLTSGDAFNCDVNCDGVYDEVTERFYYVSNMENNVASLIYYNNISQGIASDLDTYVYDESGDNSKGPVTAKFQLPTNTQWNGVSLSNAKRAVTTEIGTSSTTGGELPINFSYSGYSARLLTAQEVNNACNITVGKYPVGELDNCNYLIENTRFSSPTKGNYGYWLETPCSYLNDNVWFVDGYARIVIIGYSDRIETYAGVRPVIEVPIANIEY